MKLTLGQKLFYYTSALLILLLLVTFLVLEQSQTRQWEAYLRTQSLSFARLATPELLKRFRGDFSGTKSGGGPENADFLSVNRDLVGFSFVSSGGKSLYRSSHFVGFAELNLPADELFAGNEVLEDEAGGRFVTRTLVSGGRILCVEVPAFGPTGEKVLAAQYLFSYDSVDQRIAEVRAQFLRILLVSVLLAFVLAAVVARRVVRPIRELNSGVLAVAQGELQIRIQATSSDELGALARAFNQMAESLTTSRNELTSKNIALEQANLELRRVQESLVRAERLAVIGQLAAGVSHEIDNPVGIILGLAELMLEDSQADDPRREDLQAIIEECKRCRRITGGLLGFARSSAGEFDNVDLSRLVIDTLASLRPQKLFKYLNVEVNAPPLPTVWADADKLRQVLVNLCLNAAQAMAGEGHLVLRTLVQGSNAVIEVSDSGPGIPPEACEKIFEPFYSTKGRGEGTGLGLSICRRLVEDHGGTLTVECANGSACFRLAIPLGQEEKYFDKSSDDSIG